MSFRTRLTGFFVLIVVVPMIGFGILVFSLINQSNQGKADAHASGVATVAANLYGSASAASFAGPTDVPATAASRAIVSASSRA